MKNINCMKNKSAVSLIVLVITVVVLSILASVVVINISGSGVIDAANIVAFKSDMSTYKDIYDIYVVNENIHNLNFNEKSLNLTYEDEEYKNIFGEIPDKYKYGLKIINGKLVYETTNQKILEIVEELGMIPDRIKIISRLINCTIDNSATSVAYGEKYTAILSSAEGYTLQNVTVMMGDTNITESAYNSLNNTIEINTVTSKLVITATTSINKYFVGMNADKYNVFFSDYMILKEVEVGSSFTDTLIVSEGYELKTITVKMNDEDITEDVYDEETKQIYIAQVIGNVGITVTTKESIKVDGVIIPDGFYYVGGKKNDGLVISDNSSDAGKGVYYECTGNQFVWIPVTYTASGNMDENGLDSGFKSVFKRGYEESDGVLLKMIGDLDEVYKEPMLLDPSLETYYAMCRSVQKYGGFYIGRYLAKDGDVNTYRMETTPAHTVKITKTGIYYNNVLFTELGDLWSAGTSGAAALCEAMYENSSSVVSTLCFGVQYDAMLNFADLDTNYSVLESKNIGLLEDSMSSTFYVLTMEIYWRNEGTYRVRRGGNLYPFGYCAPQRSQGEGIAVDSFVPTLYLR